MRRRNGFSLLTNPPPILVHSYFVRCYFLQAILLSLLSIIVYWMRCRKALPFTGHHTCTHIAHTHIRQMSKMYTQKFDILRRNRLKRYTWHGLCSTYRINIYNWQACNELHESDMHLRVWHFHHFNLMVQSNDERSPCKMSNHCGVIGLCRHFSVYVVVMG